MVILCGTIAVRGSVLPEIDTLIRLSRATEVTDRDMVHLYISYEYSAERIEDLGLNAGTTVQLI